MYKLVIYDFNMYETVYAMHDSNIKIRELYHSLIKRCLYGFPDIQIIRIIKDDETISEFVNWRR